MERTQEIAVLGGAGVSGRAVVRELIATTPHRIRVSARSRGRAEALAAELGPRVSPWTVDIDDPARMRSFFEGCAAAVGAVGPAVEIEDRAARAALDAGCHYFDLGGFDLLHERFADRAQALARSGLLCSIGSGWMPGLSGTFPMYVDALASRHLDRAETLRLYYGARDDWGDAAARDMVWSIFQGWAGEFRHGRWVASSLFTRPRRVKLPSPFGDARAMPFFDNQLRRFAEQRAHAVCAAYVCELSLAATLLFLALRIVSNERSRAAARAVKWAIARDARRLGRAGMLHVVIEGRRNGAAAKVTGTLATSENHRITGVVAAAGLRMALSGQAKPGLWHFCEALDPETLMKAIAARGVSFTIADDRGHDLTAVCPAKGAARGGGPFQAEPPGGDAPNEDPCRD